jgi:hypothetical protein
MSRRILVTLLGMLAIAGLSGCSNNPTSTSLGTMMIQLTDAPGDFQEVNLVVNEVAVQHSDGNGGWEVLSSQIRTYDLLKLRNGVFSTLGISQLPAGHYNQLRLKLGAGSTVVVDNTSHPLRVSSGLQSGLKLAGSFDVPKQGRVDLALDFDVARSILPDGDGAYSLKPVIRVVTVSLPDNKPGAIHGVVAPTGAMASVFVIQNADTVASTLNDPDGNFTVLLLPAGTYQLAFHAREGYLDQTVNGVVVNMGATTDVGTIALSPIPPPPPTHGAIAGHVMPPGVPTMVSAIAAGSIVAQAAVAADGAFMIAGLPAGSFDLYIQPSDEFLEQTRSGIAVVAGQTNDIGGIELQPVPPPPPPPPPPPQLPGAISGQVMPAGIPCTAFAMQGDVTVGETPVSMDGTFTIDQLPVGSYTLVVHPLFDFLDMSIPGVIVNSGATTNVGLLQLQY